MYLSYQKANRVALEIFKPYLESELYYYGTEFHPVMFQSGKENKIEKWWGPSWNVTYDAQTEMIIQQFSVRVNLFGKITETTPPNLIEEIIPKYFEPKLKKRNLTN